MSFNYEADSLEEIHSELMATLIQAPDFEAAPRGKPIKELVAASFTLTNPRNRLIPSKVRNVNYGFAVGELCWYVRGDSDLETMLYYNKRMAQFSDDGRTINSAYGARMFKGRWSKPLPPRTARDSGPPRVPDSVSQVDMVLEELRRDPDSRRAVMHINEPTDLLRAVERGSKDVPCTMSIQLFIRDRRLHMHVLMRSNDVVWGLPYDVFSFTCLQEAFLYRLQQEGVPVDDLGSYHHTAGSLHVYDTHFAMAEEISKEVPTRPAPMTPFTLAGLQWVAEAAEPIVRESGLTGGPMCWTDVPHNPECSCVDLTRDAPQTTIDWMVGKLVDHRDKRVLERFNKEKDEQPT